MALLSILLFLCPPMWSHDENVGCPPPVSCDHGIVHLDCFSIKIFSLFKMVLSALSFILWGFCPMALLSIFAFLCPSTWSHDENVDCPPLYHVIMGSYTLIVGVLKYFLFLMVLSALSFILWGFCPMALLSIFAFLCPPMWSDDENVDCPRLYHVIMGSYTLIVGILKNFLFWGFCPLWVLSFRGFCPVALLSIFAFLCPPTWSHDENVDCPPLYHVIMGSYTLIVGVLKYFLFLMVLSVLSFILLFLLSYGAFVHFCFSLSAHMIGWQECWLSTPVSCDHLIVHLDCWNIKILSLFGGFVQCKVWPVYVYSQCIMKVFSIRMWVHYDLNNFFAFLICYGRDLCCWLEKCCKPKVEVENLEILEKSSKHSLVSLPHCTL